MDDRGHIERLARRAGFGHRPEIPLAESMEAWLADELRPAAPSAAEREARLASFSLAQRELVELRSELPEDQRAMSPGGMIRDPESRQARRRALRRLGRRVAIETSGARLVRAVHSRFTLREAMVDLWSNHFAVDLRKGFVAALVGDYERTLRHHALGRFEDLLIAVAKSPAMLVYLDNWRSVAPRRRGRRGLNENYARELLELHTVGAAAGYSQDDVIAVARVMSGWTLAGPGDPRFRFRSRLHDDAPVAVMGERVRGEGMAAGEALLRRLARHPATAEALAEKCVRRFVSDRPDPALVKRSARLYLDHEGAIAPMLAAILTSPEFATPEARKFRTPYRWFVSALRESGGSCEGSRQAIASLMRMGEAPFRARSPEGYPDDAASWIDPGAMLERIRVSFALADGAIRGVRLGSAKAHDAVSLCEPEFLWV